MTSEEEHKLVKIILALAKECSNRKTFAKDKGTCLSDKHYALGVIRGIKIALRELEKL